MMIFVYIVLVKIRKIEIDKLEKGKINHQIYAKILPIKTL